MLETWLRATWMNKLAFRSVAKVLCVWPLITLSTIEVALCIGLTLCRFHRLTVAATVTLGALLSPLVSFALFKSIQPFPLRIKTSKKSSAKTLLQILILINLLILKIIF